MANNRQGDESCGMTFLPVSFVEASRRLTNIDLRILIIILPSKNEATCSADLINFTFDERKIAMCHVVSV